MKVASNPADRWISREISGTPDTENPNAVFPRLTYGNSQNNNRASTHWLRNGRYLRLKNLTIGYTIPKKISRKLLMEGARIYFWVITLPYGIVLVGGIPSWHLTMAPDILSRRTLHSD